MNDDDFCYRIQQLLDKKRQMKVKIRNCYSQLCENRDIGLCGSLQDARGLPRQDIDVREVMRVRKQIMHMEIEYDRLIKEIRRITGELCSGLESDDEDSIISIETTLSQIPPVSSAKSFNSFYSHVDVTDTEEETSPCEAPQHNQPAKDNVIAIIVRIFPKSPASKAGLRPDDCILQFGPIDASNYDGNPVIFCTVAQQYENKKLPMRIVRESKILNKKIKPKHWCGCGLLGFLIDH